MLSPAHSPHNSCPSRSCLLKIYKSVTLKSVLLVAIFYVFGVVFWSLYSLTALQLDTKHRNPFTKFLPSFENDAFLIKDLEFGDIEKRNLTCLGWKATRKCSPNGPRDSTRDRNCSEVVPNEESGYCEVRDVDSGEHFRVMRRHCNVLRKKARFRCRDAPNFMSYRGKAHDYAEIVLQSSFHLPNVNKSEAVLRDGIVMVVFPKIAAGAYAIIRVLRDRLHCNLPIEIWFRPDEITSATILEPFRHLASADGNITFHKIEDPSARQYVAKIHAIYHSTFDRVLFLDSDNVPVRDPSFLFQSTEFVQTGAVFWPDFWHPDHSMFGFNENSLVWEMLDMSFVDMFEQESGQLLVDRRRHAAPLALVRFYALNRPNFFKSLRLLWGDKDLFRLAWLKLEIPFTMIKTPPGLAGLVQNTFLHSTFCGMTMVQHDANGEILFMHRNQHKVSGKIDQNTGTGVDPITWTHVVRFHEKSGRRNYKIIWFNLKLSFKANEKCFGRPEVYRDPNFYVQEIRAFHFSDLEPQLLRFAVEYTQLALNP